MSQPRPVSAGARESRPYHYDSLPEYCDATRVEQTLLHKIELLADRHAKNVQALDILRSSAPTRAWTDIDIDESSSYSAARRVRGRSALNPKDDYKLRSTRHAHGVRIESQRNPWSSRSFTRVTAPTARSPNREPTVVEPFRCMETHATAWKRKIAQQEEREMKEKREEEEARAWDRERFLVAVNEGTEFSGVTARSNEMMERRRARNAKAKANEEELRKRGEFKATPVLITDEDWKTIQDRQNIRRKQRGEMRRAQTASSSRLPRRMAMHALQQNTTNIDAASRRRQAPAEGGVSSSGRCVAPDRIREVLARKQQRWDQQLASTQRKKKPVVPQVLPMEERAKTYRRRAQERARKERENTAAARQRKEEANTRKKERAFSASVPVIPRTTHSFLIRTAQVRSKLERESEELKREAERRAKMRARQQETSKALADVMREVDRQRNRQGSRDTDREAAQKARDSRETYRRSLRENKARLEQATADRPTLWEQHDAEVRKEAAKRIALSTIAERVFRASATGAKCAPWKQGSAADRIFDEQEKAVLGMYSF